MIQNLDVLKERFARLMAERAPDYLALCEGYLDDKAVERAIEAFGEKSRRETFYRLQGDRDPLRDHLARRLPAGLPGALRATRRAPRGGPERLRPPGRPRPRRGAKDGMADPGAGGELGARNDAAPRPDRRENARRPEARRGASTGRVFNLGRSLAHAAAAAAGRQPYLVPIGERAEAVLDAYDDRQITTQQALQELERLFAEFSRPRRSRRGRGSTSARSRSTGS